MSKPRKRKKGNKAIISNFIKTEGQTNHILNSSRQLDEFEYLGNIIRPPYEPKDLVALIEQNDTLKQNIEAFAVNVSSFGYVIQYQDDIDVNRLTKEELKKADKEWERLRRLYKYINPLTNFNTLIYKVAVDMYSFGWGMLEVIRNGLGEVCHMEYCRSCNFRIVHNDTPRTTILTWEETEKGYEQVENIVTFKKFVQLINGRKIYFKEFGDPRKMSYRTGEYGDIPEGDLATEIAYFAIHSSYTDYGVPYWINTAVIASGNILSETLNYTYFKDGRILPIAVLVSGGQLTDESTQAISEGKGIENAFKMMVIEASPFEESATDKLMNPNGEPKVSVDIKSLTDTNNTDALFSNYQKEGKEKIRDSMRLPPIYTGASIDYNRSTADTAKQISEEQIFVPERKRICDTFNKIINNEKGIMYYELALKAPDLSDTDQKANIITALNNAGALTPNMLIPLVNEILGKETEPWDDKKGNVPFELLKLEYQNNGGEEFETEEIEKSDNDELIERLEHIYDMLRKELERESHD